MSDPSATIYPIERVKINDELVYGYPERQRVDLYLRNANAIETLTIGTGDIDDEDYLDSYAWQAIAPNHQPISKLSRGMMDDQLYISYQGKTVFSTQELAYDYIHFNSVCTGPDKRQKLLFSMVLGGSANGEVEDMLFVYYDPVSQAFQHKVIERRYLPDVCDMESALANQAKQEQLLKDVKLIHEKLRPFAEDTELHDHVASQQTLPTRQFSSTQFEAILTEYKQLIPDELELKHEYITDDELEREDELEYQYPNFYGPEFVIRDLAENTNWRIVEVLYLQLYTSWGILLAENKNTSQWTAFYTASGGDSKNHLYFNDEVELVDNELRGNFILYGNQKLAISLNDFTVQNVTRIEP